MGYDTNFWGSFKLDRPLTKLQSYYINKFAEKRHVKRNIDMLPYDPILNMLGLSVGDEGEFFIGSKLAAMPIWIPESNKFFTNNFKRLVLLLMCIQKYHMPALDKNIFFLIIQYLSTDMYTRDFNLEENLKYLPIANDDDILNFRYNEIGIVDYNSPPRKQPSLWCQWIVNDKEITIGWDRGEKFCNYIQWL